jgi:hypothetical protein
LWSLNVIHTPCRVCGQSRAYPCRHTGVKVYLGVVGGRSYYHWKWPERVGSAPVAELPQQP